MTSGPEKQNGQANLAQFLGGSLRITTKHDLEEFLDAPDARRKVQSAPYQDLFMVAKTVGLEDSLELLPLTLRQQRRGFIDLDCWRKDSFHIPSFLEWLAAFTQAGPEEVVRTARGLDPQLLTLFLKRNLKVHLIDPEEPPPDLPLIYSPDRRYAAEITGEGDAATMGRLFLDALFRFDPSLGYDLLDRVYWESEMELEEEAYQNKCQRLEEIGFVDYYQALDLYQDSAETLPPPPSPDKDLSSPAASNTVPALLVTSLHSGQYLLEGLAKINEPREAERIHYELAALSNRILSVHAISPGDLEKVPAALEEVRDTLNLALEYLSGRNKDQVEILLLESSIQTLFRAGFQQIAHLREKADKILQQGGLRIQGSQEILLDPPEQEFIAGLRRLQPRFYEGISDPGQLTYRNFRSWQDLQISRQVLDRIEGLGKLFWKLYRTESVVFPSGWKDKINLMAGEIRFGQIFCTSLASFILKGEFRLEILSPRDLRGLLTRGRELISEKNQVRLWLQEKAETLLQENISRAEEQEVLRRYFQNWIQAAADELAPHWEKTEVDPRYLRLFILDVSEKN